VSLRKLTRRASDYCATEIHRPKSSVRPILYGTVPQFSSINEGKCWVGSTQDRLKRFFSTLHSPDRFSSLTRVVSDEYRGLFAGEAKLSGREPTTAEAKYA
jgi:hypothetical protein